MKRLIALKLMDLVLFWTIPCHAQSPIQDIEALAQANGFKPSQRVVKAIEQAAIKYHVNASELAAIAILETGLGKYSAPKVNRNGSVDKGLFQINSVNYDKCVEYNLDSPEGSALCAAKLLNTLKQHRSDYLGVYHSKTPSHKTKYLLKVNRILAVNAK